jgi:hypothetical protein
MGSGISSGVGINKDVLEKAKKRLSPYTISYIL